MAAARPLTDFRNICTHTHTVFPFSFAWSNDTTYSSVSHQTSQEHFRIVRFCIRASVQGDILHSSPTVTFQFHKRVPTTL